MVLYKFGQSDSCSDPFQQLAPRNVFAPPLLHSLPSLRERTGLLSNGLRLIDKAKFSDSREVSAIANPWFIRILSPSSGRGIVSDRL